MADFTITHRIEAPELTAAINALADALKSRPVDVNPTVPAQNVPAEPASISPTVSNIAVPVTAPESVATTAPTANVIPFAPTVAAPTPAVEAPATTAKVYTFDDITAAGSQLLEAGKINDLITLLRSFGVQAVNQLKPEQYADVADGLRKLGAKI